MRKKSIVPKSETKKLSLSFPLRIIRNLTILADMENIGVNELVVRLVESEVKKRKKDVVTYIESLFDEAGVKPAEE